MAEVLERERHAVERAAPPAPGRLGLQLLRSPERPLGVWRDEDAEPPIQAPDPRETFLRRLHWRDLAPPDRAGELLDGPVHHWPSSSAAASSAAMKREGSSARARPAAARSMAAARLARSTCCDRDSVMVRSP